MPFTYLCYPSHAILLFLTLVCPYRSRFGSVLGSILASKIDPEIKHFRDHFLDVSVDLSKVNRDYVVRLGSICENYNTLMSSTLVCIQSFNASFNCLPFPRFYSCARPTPLIQYQALYLIEWKSFGCLDTISQKKYK